MDRPQSSMSPSVTPLRTLLRTLLLAVVLAAALFVPALARAQTGVETAAHDPAPRFPNVLLLTIDTLRADRLSGYGYQRPTTPNLDRLMAAGVRFDQARCVEPLTAPSLISSLTSIYPHQHGATRNGVSPRPGLETLPSILGQRGYRTAAFISNWTLRDRLTGLSSYFDQYNEIFTRKRWFGLLNAEATGEDVTEEASAWLRDHVAVHGRRPFFLWVHYTEPHAPYRLHVEQARRLGLPDREDLSRSDRYDTEVAFADDAVGNLLAVLAELYPPDRTLVVFAGDHGENLGEHGYWGHGRHLWEENLHVPTAITWPGHLGPAVLEAPASNLDLAPTVLGLLGLPAPDAFRGFDWTPVIEGKAEAPTERVTRHQAHRGAVHGTNDEDRVRRRGLLEVAIVSGNNKEVLRLKGTDTLSIYDLSRDPDEKNGARPGTDVPKLLAAWLAEVNAGLTAADNLPPPSLDPESLEQLRALGYID